MARGHPGASSGERAAWDIHQGFDNGKPVEFRIRMNAALYDRVRQILAPHVWTHAGVARSINTAEAAANSLIGREIVVEALP